MNLRITSITTSEVGELINNVTCSLEDRLCPVFEERDYGAGIQQFVVYFISVDSDPVENAKYCTSNNRASRYKHPLTGQTVKFVGISVPVDPAIVLALSQTELPKLLQNLLLDELESPVYVMPKKFERQRLLDDLRVLLA